MFHLLLVWFLSALSVVIAAYLIPPVEIENFGTTMIAAAIIGVLNATLFLLLRHAVSPHRWLVPGLVYSLVNAVSIYFVARFLRGFIVRSFGSALLCAFVVASVNVVLGTVA